MKKSLITAGLSLSLILLFSGCKDELEEKYNNPEKSTKASLPGFFTAILDNNRVRPITGMCARFCCSSRQYTARRPFFTNGNTAYQQSDGYTGQYWSDFYAHSDNGSGVMGMYRAWKRLTLN